ncbi:MAG: hypothetical protein KKB50_17795 [Planctomycetes bacterium]|nr:hypothetical protein [Planctomycetota bacterium]
MNPLFRLHLKLSGSFRNNAVLTLAYVTLVVVAASITYHLTKPADHGAASSAWLGIMTAAQAAFVLLVAPGAVRRAVLRDHETGMIESHRLSPMSNLSIVAGYLSGPPAQAALLYGVSLLLGSYFAGRYAQSFQTGGVAWVAFGGWYFLQVCLLMLAFMIAALVLLVALSTAGKTNVIGIVVLVCVFGGWVSVAFVPGLALLSGVMSGQTLLGVLSSSAVAGDARAVLLGAVLQFLMATIFVAAACRKVRAPERSMFSISLGFALLALWGAILVLGVALVPKHRWLIGDFDEIGRAQLIASTIAFMIVAFLPLVAAAALRFHIDRSAAFGQPLATWQRHRTTLVPLLLSVMTMLTLVLLYRHLDPEQVQRELIAALSSPGRRLALLATIALSFWIDFNWIYFAIVRGRKLLWSLLLVTAALKLLPIAADLAISIAYELLDRPWALVDGYFSGISPIGTFILATTPSGNPWPGLAVQIGLAAAATYLGRRTRQNIIAHTASSAAPVLPASQV